MKPRTERIPAPDDSAWSALANELQALAISQPSTSALTTSHNEPDNAPLVIVGAGPSAQALIGRLAKLGYKKPIVMINGEAFVPYNRAQISSSVADGRPLHTLAARLVDQPPIGLHVLHAARATNIDREQRELRLENGHTLHYETLILATGARPLRLPLLQTAHPRVRDFRTLYDLQALATLRPRHVLIVGGGLLGIEAARAAQVFCEHVTLIERFPHVLPRQLDAAAATRLTEQLSSLGIAVLTNRQLMALDCHDDYLAVTLDDKTALTVDLILSATGVSPEVELARAAELEIRRGIVVDDDFRSSDPHIFALGECCEQDGYTFGSLGPCLSHAERLAAVLNHSPTEARKAADVFQLKLGARTVVSIGNTRSVDAMHYAYSNLQGQYRRLFIEDNRIVGAILYDEANVDISAYTAAVGAGLSVSETELQTFRDRGALPAPTLPTDARVICFCANVSAGQLLSLRAAGKATSEIILLTGASTHCGSCATRVEQLLGSKPSHYNQVATLSATILAFLLLIGLLTGVEAPYADSWRSAYRWVDVLWRDARLRQVTGYTMLAIMLLSFAWGYWRRRLRQQQRPQSAQLGTHALFAACTLLLWYLHTGGRMGYGLNTWLLFTLLTVSVTGAFAGMAWMQSPRSALSRQTAATLRAIHWFALLPAPALLLFHILKAYYF